MPNWDAHEKYERIEQALEPLLAARGYAKTKQEHHPNVFGNRFTIFTGRSGHVRFTWDGKDAAFILRAYKKRSKVVNTLLLSLLGKYDLDKLTAEIILKRNEIETLTDEELVRKFTEKLDV